MNRPIMCRYLLIVGMILWGCSNIQSPSNTVWTSDPAVHEVDNQMVNVKFEPQKGTFPYFAFFRLTIINKSDVDLNIDWNATQYLFNGRAGGVFVFAGIDPEAVRMGSVPMETISPGTEFTREIMPMQRIAWNPLKKNTVSERRISPGILPAGANGMQLSIHHDQEVTTVPLSVRLSQVALP